MPIRRAPPSPIPEFAPVLMAAPLPPRFSPEGSYKEGVALRFCFLSVPFRERRAEKSPVFLQDLGVSAVAGAGPSMSVKGR